MQQLNNTLPVGPEENQPVAVNLNKISSPLLNQVRKNFGYFGGVSLIFGISFAFFFYRVGIGLNVFAFTTVIVLLMTLIMKKLCLSIKKTTFVYYLASILLGLSTMLTANETLQITNIVGILLLLDLSLLHQLNDDQHWDFAKHLGSMFGLLFSSIAAIGRPLVDCLGFLKKTRMLKSDRSRNIVFGVVLSLPILWVVVALLSSADLLFGNLTRNIYRFLFSSDIVIVGFMILFGIIACYSIICGATGRVTDTLSKTSKTKADPAIAATTMTIILVIYALFSGIQIIYLFANGLLVLPQEYTFSEYARRGFFELLTVTVINIGLMLICSAVFRESKVLRTILTGITFCTYIMISSATYRMLLYIGAYHLTLLRLFVLLFLFIDALLLAGVITAQYRREFPLFRYCVAVVTVCYLTFSFARPDYWIAAYQTSHKEILDAEDITYLTSDLSFDAAPIVLPLLSDQQNWSITIESSDKAAYDRYVSWDMLQEYTKLYYEKINSEREKRGIRDFNYSISAASKYCRQYPLN